MANNKKFVVKNGLTTSNIEFKDDINNGTNTITMSMLSTDVLSFSGDSGQLFSISDSLTGTIFSVNDISGIPSVEVDDDGTIRLAEFAGNILVGSNTDNGSDKLQVTGNTSVNGTIKATDFTIGTSGKLTSNNYIQTQLGTKLNSSSYTASDVLTKIKTVDGSGSGLDADTLDGIQGSSYSSNNYITDHYTSNNYIQTYVAAQVASVVDSAPAALNTLNELAAALGDDANFSTTVSNQIGIRSTNTYVNSTFSSNNYLQGQLSTKLSSSSYTASDVLTKIKTVDGSGSGLDADLLDGQQGSYYLNTSTSFGGDVSGTYNNIVVSNDSHNHSSSSGNFTVGGDLTVSGGQVTMAGVPTRDKYRVWSSSTYAIGMDNNFTFGGLATEYAMTFQMNDQATRGFWWGDSAHTDAQGAMALTTNGKLTVAHSTRIGYGETDTTTPGATHRVDVNGSVNATTYHGDGSNLTGISAGATGGGSDKIFYNNDQTVTTSYTIPTGQNSMTAGPISINSGVTVTVPSGSEWTIV